MTRLKKRPIQVLKVIHDWAFRDLRHKPSPVRTEPVFPIVLSLSKGVPEHPEPVEGTEPVEVPRNRWQGFDRLSPNGEGFVSCLFEFPIILSLSKGRLSPNGVRGVFRMAEFPIILSVVVGQRNPRYETQPVRTEPVEVALPKFATRSLDRLRTDAEVELVMQAIINSPQTPVFSWH
jgi:hypothetical protein